MLNDSENSRFAHDLRNSLSAIYSYTQILELMLDTPTTQKERDIAKSICVSAKKMNVLIRAHEEAFRGNAQAAVSLERLAETEGSTC